MFEERYLQMMEDVLPEAPFAVAAIRHGQEVGGPYEPYRVGVTRGGARTTTSTRRRDLRGRTSVAATGSRWCGRSPTDPYPRWQVEPYPDEGGAGTDDVEAAADGA